MEYSSYVVLGLVLLLSHLIQGITGFGAVVLALPVLVFFFPLKVLIPAVVVVNLTQAGWFAVTQRRHIHRGHARSIILLSLLGLPLGYAIYRYLPTEQLKIGLGLFVIVVASWNLMGLKLERPVPRAWYQLLNFLGGITQGALASGGPFLVIYAARMLTNKSEFRATLSLVWTVLNLILCATYVATGGFCREQIPLILVALPSVSLGTVLGIVLHDRTPEKPFRTLVFSILLLSGLVLLKPLFS